MSAVRQKIIRETEKPLKKRKSLCTGRQQRYCVGAPYQRRCAGVRTTAPHPLYLLRQQQDRLSLRDRSIITVSALVASGVLDSSLKFHIQNAKNNGVTKDEMAEILTHLAFYSGWPKAWAGFYMAKEVYGERS